MKKTGALVPIALFVLTLSPIASSGQQLKYGGELVFGTESDIKQLDPHKGFTAIEGRIFTLVCNNLIESGKEYEAQPGLAQSWDVSSDGKEWTFHLSKGVRFHNGREMTAEDIKFNFDRIMDPKTGAAMRSRFLLVDSVKVVDPYTVKFFLKKTSGGFLAGFFGSGVQSPIIARECVKVDGTITHPIGTGPFEFVGWKANDYTKLRKFKDYWRKGLPYLDKLLLRPVPDETVRLSALRAGDVDIAFPLPIDEVAKLMKKPERDVHFSMEPQGAFQFINFNVAKPPFSDVRVRQAVAYGINKKEIMEGIYHGYGEVVNQNFKRGSPWYCDVPELGRDIQKAKALLKEAGYASGIELKLNTSSTYPQQFIMAQIIQAQLREIGMKIELDVSDWPTHVKKTMAGQFAFGVSGWSVLADPDLLYPAAFRPDGAYAFISGKAYNNPRLVELIDQASGTIDFGKRKEIYTKIIKIIVEDAPWIFVCTGPAPVGIRSHVKGFEAHINCLFSYAGGGLQYTWLDK